MRHFSRRRSCSDCNYTRLVLFPLLSFHPAYLRIRFSSLVYTSDFNEPLNEGRIHPKIPTDLNPIFTEVRQYRENSDTQPLADRIEAYLISISWRQDTVDKSLEALKTDPATKDVVASIFSVSVSCTFARPSLISIAWRVLVRLAGRHRTSNV